MQAVRAPCEVVRTGTFKITSDEINGFVEFNQAIRQEP
jgi:hypothetical protein